jgi:hypothetical protein
MPVALLRTRWVEIFLDFNAADFGDDYVFQQSTLRIIKSFFNVISGHLAVADPDIISEIATRYATEVTSDARVVWV